MSDPVAVVLASLPDYGQVLGLAAVDLHGLDGPRYYAGLGFAPVPGNPHGLVRLQDGAELLADEAARAAGALDSVRDVAWEGADAAAFRSRVEALPPVLLRYATALRQFSVLADDAHAALRTGKGRAEALDREAVAVKASLVSSGPLTLPGEVARLVHLLGEGVELYRETRARLTELGLEMEALSRQLPRGPDTAVSRWVDTVADATGYLDRTFGSPITHAAVDAHPAEAHLLYRRGATNVRGEAIVTRAEYLAAAATAVPLPAVGPETRGAVRAVTQATEQARRTDEVLAGGPPETPLQRVSAVATATGSPFVPPVLDYLDDRGVGSGRRAAPDVRVRVRTAGPPCRR
jgi:hypothetical protein